MRSLERTMAKFALLLAFASSRSARAAGDVFDQFHRYTEKQNRVFAQELPGETIHPFASTLRILQIDLFLPVKAGLDVKRARPVRAAPASTFREGPP